MTTPNSEAGLSNKRFDLFISHASEDKDTFARPLFEALRAAQISVWFDEATLRLGDRLREKIDEGLAQCRYGIVILSPHFLAKPWPQRELDGLVARETVSGENAILPIWLDIDAKTLVARSPTLADRVAALSKEGIPAIVEKIKEVLRTGSSSTRGEMHRADRPPMQVESFESGATAKSQSAPKKKTQLVKVPPATNTLFFWTLLFLLILCTIVLILLAVAPAATRKAILASAFFFAMLAATPSVIRAFRPRRVALQVLVLFAVLGTVFVALAVMRREIMRLTTSTQQQEMAMDAREDRESESTAIQLSNGSATTTTDVELKGGGQSSPLIDSGPHVIPSSDNNRNAGLSPNGADENRNPQAAPFIGAGILPSKFAGDQKKIEGPQGSCKERSLIISSSAPQCGPERSCAMPQCSVTNDGRSFGMAYSLGRCGTDYPWAQCRFNSVDFNAFDADHGATGILEIRFSLVGGIRGQKSNDFGLYYGNFPGRKRLALFTHQELTQGVQSGVYTRYFRPADAVCLPEPGLPRSCMSGCADGKWDAPRRPECILNFDHAPLWLAAEHCQGTPVDATISQIEVNYLTGPACTCRQDSDCRDSQRPLCNKYAQVCVPS